MTVSDLEVFLAIENLSECNFMYTFVQQLTSAADARPVSGS